MNIAIIGGTGFIGRHLADVLIEHGHTVRAVARSRPSRFVERPGIELHQADVTDSNALFKAIDGADAVVYSVGLLREDLTNGQSFEDIQFRGVVNAVEGARRAGIERFVLLSANGVRPDGTAYQSTKFRSEEIVRMSGLDYSIMRPSVVFGDSGQAQEFSWQLYRDIVRPPLPAPEFLVRWLPHKRHVLMSPVAVDDVVDAIVRQLEDPVNSERTFELGGPEKLSWGQMLGRIAAATGRKKLFVPVPIKLMMLPALLLGRFSFFPVTADQLRMLAEGNVAEPAALRSLIEREPLAFQPENLAYLREETD